VSAGKDKSSVFKVHGVHVKVDSLKFSIRDSKHDFLYNTLRPLATGLVKRQIQKAIRDALHTGLEYVDGQLVAVRDRMEEAKKEEDGEGRMEVLKNVSVFYIAELVLWLIDMLVDVPAEEGRGVCQIGPWRVTLQGCVQ
jgi:hypothetical protein